VTVQPTGLGDLAAVRRVRCADVYKGDRLAARLNRTDEGVEFAYLADYLDADGQAVATTVPLTDIPVVTAAGAVPPFFAGLLPEGRRPSSLRRAVKTSADDELSLLLAVGADPVGDVRVFPEGAVPAEAPALVTVGRSFEEVTFAEVLEAAGGVDLVALAGVQDKASARMLSVPVRQAGRRATSSSSSRRSSPTWWPTRRTSSPWRPGPDCLW
jgi:serine/threonine-protein kinase HipA